MPRRDRELPPPGWRREDPISDGSDTTLFMLAFDQRTSFSAGLFGIKGTPTAEEVARIADAKRVIFEGLQLAVVDGAPKASAGLLVDEQFGSEVARAARTDGYILAMPVEKSGLAEFDFEYGAAFGEHIEAFDPTFAKVLVRYNPDGNAATNLAQRTRLAGLSSWLKGHGRRLLFELLVPAEPAQLGRVGGDRDRYDLEVRPELTIRSIAEFQAASVEPEIWKVEGLDRREDYVRVAQQAQSAGRDQVACIILGGGSSDAKVEHWLRQEAGVPGFIGFAIGRTIWHQPLENWLARKLDRGAATRSIADNYLRMINVYQDARGRLAAVDLASDRGL